MEKREIMHKIDIKNLFSNNTKFNAKIKEFLQKNY